MKYNLDAINHIIKAGSSSPTTRILKKQPTQTKMFIFSIKHRNDQIKQRNTCYYTNQIFVVQYTEYKSYKIYQQQASVLIASSRSNYR